VDAAAGVGAGGYLVYKRLAAGEMEARLGSTRQAVRADGLPSQSYVGARKTL